MAFIGKLTAETAINDQMIIIAKEKNIISISVLFITIPPFHSE